MKNSIKKILPFIPKQLQRLLYGSYEGYFSFISTLKEKNDFKLSKKDNARPRILFYHPSGLSFGGTEKFLQILAKYIDKNRYEIFYMYAPQNPSGRLSYLNDTNIQMIPFSFTTKESRYPFFMNNMSPTLREVVARNSIDLIITAGTGYSEHAFNTIKETPIMMLNVFGAPSVQKNIVKHVCISHEVSSKIQPIVPKEKIEVMYIPSEKPSNSFKEKGLALRASLGLTENDVVFGRIGRADDGIYDPIGIEAFKEVVREFPHAHYLIQSPPPILMKKVAEESIPNVHFLEASSEEERVWAFHFAIDALAHFRNDGESCGLNIIESMIAGKPIITHRSHIWNAHLEYLQPSFSRIADKDDMLTYAGYMKEYISLKNEDSLFEMGEKAKLKGQEFLIENNIKKFERWMDL